jgi:DNA-binding PadR family transcriptional regulator
MLRQVLSGFIRLHILYHAELEPICGVEIMEELRRHGYKVGPGTIYPMLHDLEEAGCLSRRDTIVAGKRRRNYRITKRGSRLLGAAKGKLRELFRELVEDRTPTK